MSTPEYLSGRRKSKSVMNAIINEEEDNGITDIPFPGRDGETINFPLPRDTPKFALPTEVMGAVLYTILYTQVVDSLIDVTEIMEQENWHPTGATEVEKLVISNAINTFNLFEELTYVNCLPPETAASFREISAKLALADTIISVMARLEDRAPSMTPEEQEKLRALVESHGGQMKEGAAVRPEVDKITELLKGIFDIPTS